MDVKENREETLLSKFYIRVYNISSMLTTRTKYCIFNKVNEQELEYVLTYKNKENVEEDYIDNQIYKRKQNYKIK